MRRFSYYYVKPVRTTLERREVSNHSSTWKVLAILLAVIAILAVLTMIYRRINVLLSRRKNKAHGQGSHLHAHSLRNKQNHADDEIEYGSPFNYQRNTEFVCSFYVNMPSRPMSTYASHLSHHAHGRSYSQQSTPDGLEDIDHTRATHVVDNRHPQDGVEPAEAYFTRRF